YEGTPTDGSAVDAPGCTKRGIRGGSWNIGPKFARFQNRSSVSPETRNWGIGFRLAHDAD
ncbi:MAG: SUMF1/EgtB/PvdO family nonheme iron enzyme, partial [Rhodospirillaceae bacterium]|nr:SUMF1/EgtB/PvdO family nonheme iron enzyme [Rhodospirillaceae bacterium]